jgi:hypothetical protein
VIITQEDFQIMTTSHIIAPVGKSVSPVTLGLVTLLLHHPIALVAGVPATKYRPAQAEAAATAPRAAGGPEEDLRAYEPAKVFGIPSAAAALASPGTTVGETYYDYQHNSSTGRQVDEFGGVIQTAYMRQSLPQLSPGRQVLWNKVEVTGSPAPFLLDNGGTLSRLPLGLPASALGASVGPEDQQGYTTMRLTPNGRAAVFYHAIGALGSWAVALDQSAASGTFTVSAAPQPGVLINPVIWPHSAVDVVGSDTILHVVGTWSDNYFETWYWRGVVSAGTSTVTWSAPVLLDTALAVSAVVEADPTSDRVAIVYSRNVSSDLIYCLSTDGGMSWAPGVNITAYTGSSPQRAWGNVAAVFDEDGTVHVVYNTNSAQYVMGQYIPAMIWHWNDVRQTSRTIAAAHWLNTCSLGWPGRGQSADLQLSRPNISVKPAGAGPGSGLADELLYAVWVQYGPTQTDCATQADGVTPGGLVNSELWCSVSSDNGLSWDTPQNITGTESPDCGLGDCHSENWVSAAALADSGVYLSYVDDTHSGAMVNNEGGWSLSPYKVLALAARTPVASSRLVVLPVEPSTWTTPHWDNRITLSNPLPGVTTDRIEVSNPGNSQLDYTASIVNNGPVLSTPLVNGLAGFNGSIAVGEAPETLTVSYDPVTGGYLDFELQITSNAAARALSTNSASFLMHWQWGAADDQYWQPLGSGITDPSSGSVLALTEFAGQLIVGGYQFRTYPPSAFVSGWDGSTWSPLGDGLQYSPWALTAYNGELFEGGFVPGPGTDYPKLVSSWNGASWSPRGAGLDVNGYQVTGLTLYNGKLVACGEDYGGPGLISSWDGASWTPLGSGTDRAVWTVAVYDGKLIAGGWFTTAGGNPASNIASWDGSSWSQVGTGVNGAVYSLCEFQNELIVGGAFTLAGGGPADYIARWNGTSWSPLGAGTNSWVQALCVHDQKLIVGGGFSMAGGHPASCIASWDGSTWSPLGSGIAGEVRTLSVFRDTLVAGGYFDHAGNKPIKFIAQWTKPVSCPIAVTGDVNVSGSITSADVITLVNYVFKSGLPPQPCAAAGDVNCNGTVTSADVISLVNYVFKGGTPPCDACTSPLASGC